jgi:hypothetical protein
MAGSQGSWAGQWSVPPPIGYAPPTPPGYTPPGWDPQTLAANFQTMTLQQPQQHEWYFDSGATHHMTSDAGILTSTPTSSFPPNIIVGNGHLLPVTTTGAAHLPHDLHLNNVLVSPNLIKNLISVRQFTSDNNCYVEFDPFGCSVNVLLE